MSLYTSVRDWFAGSRAATLQIQGHPAAGVIGWWNPETNTSGEVVNEQTALNYSAVWCATRVISETLASLPCMLYRRTGDGRGREKASDDPRFRLVFDTPNPDMSAYTWFEVSTQHMVNWGNAYSRIRRQGDQTISLNLRHPSQVRIEKDGDQYLYIVRDPEEVVERDSMLHPIGLNDDGIKGFSVITKAQQSIGSAMAADKYAGSFFGSGATPSGALTIPMRLDKQKREQFRREWNEMHQGASKSNNIAILHGGIEYKQLGMSNEDAQFLESRQFSVTEIARWYRIAPHLLFELSKATFSNIENQSLEFVKYSMRPWIERWESALNKWLLTEDERRTMFFEFSVDSLLRGDFASRTSGNATARQWGWKSVNEIRQEDGLNPIDGGDMYLQPLNMVPAGTVPEEMGQQFRDNLTGTIQTILDTANEMRVDLETQRGNQQIADDVLNDRLSSLRESNLELRQAVSEMDRPATTVSIPADIGDSAAELLADVLTKARKHMLTRATRAAQAQISRGESYVGWLEQYAEEHVETLTEQLRKPARIYASVNGLDDKLLVSHLATIHTGEITRKLLDAADGDRNGFGARVDAANWDHSETYYVQQAHYEQEAGSCTTT